VGYGHHSQVLGIMYSKEHKVLRPYLNLLRTEICDVVLKQPHKIYVGYLWNHWYVFIIRIGLKVCTMTREEKRALGPKHIFFGSLAINKASIHHIYPI
jgi:hypothetical protein